MKASPLVSILCPRTRTNLTKTVSHTSVGAHTHLDVKVVSRRSRAKGVHGRELGLALLSVPFHGDNHSFFRSSPSPLSLRSLRLAEPDDLHAASFPGSAVGDEQRGEGG